MDASLKTQFEQQISLKKNSFNAEQRAILSEVLTEQYSKLTLSDKLKENLSRLSQANTFCITTGHQLCLMTGPLYFIYKILHVIKLAEDLKKTFPEQHFVPIYWMATEDHDFEEIRSFSLFGQKWTWQSAQKGAVGRFEIKDLAPLLAALGEKFQNHVEAEIHHLISQLQSSRVYKDGFFRFIHALFSAYGLVIVDADQSMFKKSAWPLWQKDLYSNDIHHAVLKQTRELQEQGYPTPIESKTTNLFLLKKQNRLRIEKNEAEAFKKEDSPHLSPNVVLRPLYQEWILPNLAYVGGPSETAYWRQLPLAFETMGIDFPLIIERAGGILLQKRDQEQIQQLGFELSDFLIDKILLKGRYLEHNGDQKPDYSKLRAHLDSYITSFKALARTEIPQELRMVEAELTRIEKQIISLEQRFEKVRKSKYDKALKQIDQLSEKIQPKGLLQERQTNLLNFCPDGELSSRIGQIYSQLDPFNEEKQWFVVS